MFIAFLLEGLGIYALILFANSPILFVLFSLGIFRLGRNFCAVPSNLHRHLWQEIRNRELRYALYGQEWPLCWSRWPTCLLLQREADRRLCRHRRSA